MDAQVSYPTDQVFQFICVWDILTWSGKSYIGFNCLVSCVGSEFRSTGIFFELTFLASMSSEKSLHIQKKICYSVHIQNYTFLLATLSVCSFILNAGPFNSQISIVFCFRKFPQSRFILNSQNSQLIFFPFCYYPCLSLPINKSQTVSGIFVPSSARKRNWSIILNASIKRMCEK